MATIAANDSKIKKSPLESPDAPSDIMPNATPEFLTCAKSKKPVITSTRYGVARFDDQLLGRLIRRKNNRGNYYEQEPFSASRILTYSLFGSSSYSGVIPDSLNTPAQRGQTSGYSLSDPISGSRTQHLGHLSPSALETVTRVFAMSSSISASAARFCCWFYFQLRDDEIIIRVFHTGHRAGDTIRRFYKHLCFERRSDQARRLVILPTLYRLPAVPQILFPTWNALHH